MYEQNERSRPIIPPNLDCIWALLKTKLKVTCTRPKPVLAFILLFQGKRGFFVLLSLVKRISIFLKECLECDMCATVLFYYLGIPQHIQNFPGQR